MGKKSLMLKLTSYYCSTPDPKEQQACKMFIPINSLDGYSFKYGTIPITVEDSNACVFFRFPFHTCLWTLLKKEILAKKKEKEI